jgi:hypothetical protein
MLTCMLHTAHAAQKAHACRRPGPEQQRCSPSRRSMLLLSQELDQAIRPDSDDDVMMMMLMMTRGSKSTRRDRQPLAGSQSLRSPSARQPLPQHRECPETWQWTA